MMLRLSILENHCYCWSREVFQYFKHILHILDPHMLMNADMIP